MLNHRNRLNGFNSNFKIFSGLCANTIDISIRKCEKHDIDVHCPSHFKFLWRHDCGLRFLTSTVAFFSRASQIKDCFVIELGKFAVVPRTKPHATAVVSWGRGKECVRLCDCCFFVVWRTFRKAERMRFSHPVCAKILAEKQALWSAKYWLLAATSLEKSFNEFIEFTVVNWFLKAIIIGLRKP